MDLKIIKASGLSEPFDPGKLRDSLVRSGAPQDVAGEIAEKVRRQISPGMSTRQVFRMARRLLRGYSRATGMKYSIRKAISDLGPSGYPFERYVAKLLEAHGYRVELNRFLEGYCVRHEVDVVATTEGRHFFVECKFHADGGKPTDVKVALYIHARFLDIKKACEEREPESGVIHEGMLVTNTRCTSDAIRFAECAGLRIVSWKYPETFSLERMIEEKRLYPVTILASIRRSQTDALLRNGIVLAQDIADMDVETFTKRSALDLEAARVLKKEADEICPCSARPPGDPRGDSLLSSKSRDRIRKQA